MPGLRGSLCTARGDVFGDVARVEGRGSVAGNRLECVGQRGIGQLVAGREGPALRVEEIGARFRRKALRVGLGEQLGEAGRDGETFAGKRDGGLKQFRPRQLAVLVVGELQRGERAGHADRKTARHRRVARQRLAVRIEEELGRGGGGRGLAAVDACELLGAGVPIENVAAAADARGLRLDQIEHHLRGDARVDRAAAFAQDGEPGFGRQRMGGDNHVPLRGDERLWLKPALAFRLLEGERTQCQARSR